MPRPFSALLLGISLVLGQQGGLSAEPPAGPRIVADMAHLRNEATREWSSFPEAAEAAQLDVQFAAEANAAEYALRLRQQDVKQTWRVLVNDKPLGELVREEADLIAYLPIAAGVLIDGDNRLRIECTARGAKASDDIRVGEIELVKRPVREVLSAGTIEIEVLDAESQQPLPCRITIANTSGARQTTAAVSADRLAVRPGVIYTADGKAQFGLPAGEYTIYASRGFEYSLAEASVSARPGTNSRRTLVLRREVPTPGYVACDTHIHTLTHSGHGDASIDERMITLAGEGIELPIATDHNKHIDYHAHAERLGVRRYFTPVTGNEYTTPVGHFNIFPVQANLPSPDHRLQDWPSIFNAVFATPGAKVAILNHARDLHSGTRPFGAESFNAALGENLRSWPMRFNAIEVINSGATQTDPLQLARDWMAVLNRGYCVAPIGASDSHDVARYIVGQGRTYVRVLDGDAGALDVDAAIASLLQGRVNVSYGLLAEVTVNGKYTSGELAALGGDDEIDVRMRVLGPRWVHAKSVQLYANGSLVRDEPIAAAPESPRARQNSGIQFDRTWRLPRPKHDVHLVAVALGEGVDGPYWLTAKPYQPTSPDWHPYTLGVSGAVWIDGDSDGRRQSARDYSERVFASCGGSLENLVAALAPLDAATATQAAELYRAAGGSLQTPEWERSTESAPPAVAAGFRAYWKAWRDSELARAGQ